MYRDEPLMFADAIAIASDENKSYLGDRETLGAMLRVAASDFMDAPGIKTAQRIAKACAKIALGDDENYTPVPRWNQPGAIDQFCGDWINSTETDPRERMEHFFVEYLLDLLNLQTYASQPGVLPEQWQWQADAIFDEYTDVLLGLQPNNTE